VLIRDEAVCPGSDSSSVTSREVIPNYSFFHVAGQFHTQFIHGLRVGREQRHFSKAQKPRREFLDCPKGLWLYPEAER